MPALRLLVLVYAILWAGCSVPEKTVPGELTEAEREDLLDRDLEPMIQGLISNIKEHRVALFGFYAEGTKIEPRVSVYVLPRIKNRLIRAGFEVLERTDLSPIVREQVLDAPYREEVGKISGADVVVIGTMRGPSLSAYLLEAKILDVDTAATIAIPSCTVHKRHLPPRYGGK